MFHRIYFGRWVMLGCFVSNAAAQGIFTILDVGAGGIGINAVDRMEVTAGAYTTVLEGLAGMCVLIAGIIILYGMQPRKKEEAAKAIYG